jgi:hypothetical protein
MRICQAKSDWEAYDINVRFAATWYALDKLIDTLLHQFLSSAFIYNSHHLATMAKLSLALLSIAALLLASNCHAARPQRQLAQATASSNSVAGPGETVVSRSGATSEDGELTVSDVSAAGAGPGTTVTCEQQAASGQVLSKECGGPGETTAVTPSAAGPEEEAEAEAKADATATAAPAAEEPAEVGLTAAARHVVTRRCLFRNS